MQSRPCLVFILVFSCLLLGLPNLLGQSAVARTSLSSKTIQIGDQLNLSIQLSAPTGTDIGEIDFSRAFADNPAELVRLQPMQTVAEKPELLTQQVLTLQLFDTGYVFTPAFYIPIRYPDGSADTLQTESLLITVTGIPVEEDVELMPIKPIIKEPLRWTDFWPLYLATLALLLAYAGFSYWRKTKTPPPPVPIEKRPAHLLALEQLDALVAKNLWQSGQIPSYYTELSYILRAYLEARFDIPAMESTSRQIIKALAEKQRIDETQTQELSQLLQLSDLVKFAKAQPGENIHEQSVRRVRTFIQSQADSDETSKTMQNEEE